MSLLPRTMNSVWLLVQGLGTVGRITGLRESEGDEADVSDTPWEQVPQPLPVGSTSDTLSTVSRTVRCIC